MLVLLSFLLLSLPFVGMAQTPDFNNYYQLQLQSSPTYDLSKAKLEVQLYDPHTTTSVNISPKQQLEKETLKIEFHCIYYHTLTLYITCPNQQTQALDSLCLLFIPSPVFSTHFYIKAFPFQQGTYVPMFNPELYKAGEPTDARPKTYEISFRALIPLKTPLQKKADTATTEDIINQYLKYDAASVGKFQVFTGAPKKQPIDAIDAEQLILYENGTFVYLRTVPNIDHSNDYYTVGTWRAQGKYLILRSGTQKKQNRYIQLGYYNDFTFRIWKRQGQQLVPLQAFMTPAYFNTWTLKKQS